jgi:hypothetical protein
MEATMRRNLTKTLGLTALAAAAGWLTLACTSSTNGGSGQQYQHVMLISVDGMHAMDLANYVAANPNSNLAQLSQSGTTYTNAHCSHPSDSFPGLVALTTGGSPQTTGIWYDDTYNRDLLPTAAAVAGGAADVPGTEVQYAENLDLDGSRLDAGGGIDANQLPRDPVTKLPIYPHSYLRVNTVFEVIHEAGMRTAWCDKHPAYDLMNGPSGKGVSDLYTPEINSLVPGKTADWTKNVLDCAYNDSLKVAAVVNEIKGLDHTGTASVGVPAIFGMNFQALSVAQKLAGNGYYDAAGTPSDGVKKALAAVDNSIGQMVTALKAQNLFSSTLIIITAKHGQSPIDVSLRQAINDGQYDTVIGSNEAFHVADDIGLVWLKDQSQTASAVTALTANQASLGIQTLHSGAGLTAMFADPTVDHRVPDIIAEVNRGVIYTTGSKIAEHGGFSEEDTHVAMLVSSPVQGQFKVTSQVTTTQVAPTILKALGLDPTKLQAVVKENTKLLPGMGSMY